MSGPPSGKKHFFWKRIKEVKNPRLIETGTRRATINVVDART